MPLHPSLHQATGMLTVEPGVDLDRTFARLQAYAAASGRSVVEAADDVIHRRVVIGERAGVAGERPLVG